MERHRRTARPAGEAAETAGHRRTAPAAGLDPLVGGADQADATGQFTALRERHRDAWDRFVDLTDAVGDVAAERLSIPSVDTTLPGHLFRSRPADEPRRTLVVTDGSDGSVADAWTPGPAQARARGWDAVTYDGPGQNAALVRKGIPFRPEWESVLTPCGGTRRPGMSSVAVPIVAAAPAGPDDGEPQVLAALGVVLPRLGAQRQRYVSTLQVAARGIGGQLAPTTLPPSGR
ncbi:hypothetical protein [Geodermatophilus sp. URMC 62]|uniref:hypothetical protein n=1 Tax=Geodermatophilus sp. URMC 62 TaxID=3423414 RepID=UPI00406C53F3